MVDTLFWHNSEVRGVNLTTDPIVEARLTLSAGAVDRQAEGAAPSAKESGFMAPLEVIFEQALVTGDLNECLGGIAHGEWRVAKMASHTQRAITLPWHCTQALTLTLQFRNGSQLQIAAQAAHCVPGPDARFMVSYAC